MTNPEWWDYIGGSKSRGSLSLFPSLDEDFPEYDLGALERDRFRWLLEVSEKTPEQLFSLWTNRNLLMEERASSKIEKLEDFYASSEVFGYHLLREEVYQTSYLLSLRNCLRLRLEPEEPVVFIGPTAGGELEAIRSAGGFPILATLVPDPKWEEFTSLKMFEIRVPYEDWSMADVMRRSAPFRFVIISSWCTEPQTYTRLAVGALGTYGWFITPATNLSALHEAKQLSLHAVDTFQREVGVFYKPVATGDLECS